MIQQRTSTGNFFSANFTDVSLYGSADQIGVTFGKILSLLFHRKTESLTINRSTGFDLRLNPSLFQKLSKKVD